MLVTLSGMLMLVRDLHQENASSPMLVTLSGILIQVSDSHPPNAKFPILVTLSGILYVLSFALYAIIIVLSALNKTLFSYINDFDSKLKEPFQPANGFPSILITLPGILMLVSDLHPAKALLPMLVTLSGILMLVSELSQRNAPLQITFVPSFII